MPKAVHSKPPRLAPLHTTVRVASDPANLAVLPAVLGSLLIVAADASPRLALILALTAMLLVLTRLRHAATIAVLLLSLFAAAALLHVPAITIPPHGGS